MGSKETPAEAPVGPAVQAPAQTHLQSPGHNQMQPPQAYPDYKMEYKQPPDPPEADERYLETEKLSCVEICGTFCNFCLSGGKPNGSKARVAGAAGGIAGAYGGAC